MKRREFMQYCLASAAFNTYQPNQMSSLNNAFQIIQNNLFPNPPSFSFDDLLRENNIDPVFFSTPVLMNNTNAAFKESLRVTSWNIEWAKHLEDILNAFDYVRELKETDIFLIQEVPIEYIEKLARNYNYAFGINYYTLKEDKTLGVGLGDMILSRYTIRDPKIIRLPMGYDHFTDNRRIGTPIALKTDISGIDIYCTHFEMKTSPEYRKKEMKSLIDSLDTEKVIIGGDFNVLWNSNERSIQLALDNEFIDPIGLTHKPTVNREDAHYTRLLGLSTATLDRILSRNMTVRNHRILSEVAISDHYPVTVEYLL